MTRMIDLFDGFCQVYIDKNVDRLMELFAEDATMVGPGFSASNKNEIRKLFEAEAPKFEDYSVKKRLVLEKGNEIAVEWHVHHRYVPTGKEFDADGATLIKMENGLIRSLRDYCDFPPPQPC